LLDNANKELFGTCDATVNISKVVCYANTGEIIRIKQYTLLNK